MRTSFCTIIFYIIFNISAFSQKEANLWYSGSSHLALDFNSGTPVFLNDNAMDNPVINRNSCIADSNGNLLFYSDGESVWNRVHQKMPNGIGLKGDYRTWQSSIVIPNPSDKKIYYLFTLGQAGDSLYYSVIDMRADDGRGDVIAKNIFLADSMTERIAAVRHHNGKDYWVVTNKWVVSDKQNAGEFYSYLVTETGVTATPVVSLTGSVPGGFSIFYTRPNTQGTMKISPDGRRLALAFVEGALEPDQDSIRYAELFQFDDRTGSVNFITKLLSLAKESRLTDNMHFCMDLEFSPDGSKLYLPMVYRPHYKSYYSELIQYDLDACSASSILNSAYTVATVPFNVPGFEGVQLVTNGKIYLPGAGITFGGVINRPNLSGENCGYEQIHLDFGGRTIPNFISSFFWKGPAIPIAHTPACLGDTTYFSLVDTFRVKKVTWKFYHPINGTFTSSEELFPKYFYPTAGIHLVDAQIEYDYKCSKSIVSYLVNVDSLPVITYTNDTLLCAKDTLYLNVFNQDASYLWEDGSTDPDYYVSNPDTVSVKVRRGACINKDTIIVGFKPLPVVNLGRDTILCTGESLLLNAFQSGGSYLWQDGTFQPDITILQPDTVWVDVTMNDCKTRDSVIVNFIDAPSINLGQDTVLCKGQALSLSAHADSASYIWNDGSILSTKSITVADTAWVQVTNKCGNDKDSIIVRFITEPVISLGNDTVLCYHDSLLITLPDSYNYTWNDSDKGSDYVITSSGIYSVEAKNKCGTATASKKVETISCCDPVVPNLLTPNKDGLNEILKISCIEDRGWKLEISNRWGEIVYSDTNYENDLNASRLEEGIYFYSLSKEGRKESKGWIQVVK